MSDLNPQRKEIYYANLEPVKGSEQGRSRPVLIISNNLMNKYAKIVIIIPITSDTVKQGPFNVPIENSKIKIDIDSLKELEKIVGFKYREINRTALCNQARAISKQRLIMRIGIIEDLPIIHNMEEAIKHSFSIDGCYVCDIPLRPKSLSCSNCGTIYKKKCNVCGSITNDSFKYCPHCGGRF